MADGDGAVYKDASADLLLPAIVASGDATANATTATALLLVLLLQVLMLLAWMLPLVLHLSNRRASTVEHWKAHVLYQQSRTVFLVYYCNGKLWTAGDAVSDLSWYDLNKHTLKQ